MVVRLALLLALGPGAGPAAAATERATVGSGQRAALVDHRDLYLEATPLAGEGLLAFCRRLTGAGTGCREIAERNRRPKRLLAGVRYRVPYHLLADDLKLAVLRALFPDDRGSPEGWLHRSRGEDLTRVAAWLTGNSRNAETLRRDNGLRSDRLRSGQTVRVADRLLLEVFRTRAAPPPRPAAAPAAAATAGAPPPARLEYGADAAGRYALYRLRGGEALYSAVVVRFTGRLHAEDVSELAHEIAVRSGIVDVTDIPIGYPVKIPLDFLQPEFLPEGDPRRLEWEVEQALAARYRNVEMARGLEGVTVILDAGHGGADVGASMSGVWESTYVYDIVLRIKHKLESTTLARVETTTRDGDRYLIVDRDVLPYSRGHAVLTSPPYPIADSTIGVHFRWYLANSLYARARATAKSAKVIFISVHADSLHPSVRGATAYIANVAGSAGTYGRSGPVFDQRKEYRERPRVSFALGERQRSEGLSRDLATRLIAALRQRELPIHPFQPVRDRIYRGRRAWVPAVLRYNAVPAKLLLEVCNLANAEDRRSLQSRAFRDRFAESVTKGILAYFGEGSS